MIEPWAKDVWSGKCHNEIYIDANQLIGAGVSLRVLMHAFKGRTMSGFLQFMVCTTIIAWPME
jgi:hypothetical protein